MELNTYVNACLQALSVEQRAKQIPFRTYRARMHPFTR